MKIINLSRGLVALVDDEDYENLKRIKWSVRHSKGKYYAENRAAGSMHNFLMHPKKPMQVDHIDGDGLNNQRSNLRICAQRENCFNRAKLNKPCASKYKGVSWHSVNHYWVSRIGINGKRIHLGVFEDELDAARTYDEAAMNYFGEYAKFNFPEVMS